MMLHRAGSLGVAASIGIFKQGAEHHNSGCWKKYYIVTRRWSNVYEVYKVFHLSFNI